MNDLANEQAPEAQADHENHIDTVRVHLLDQLKALRQAGSAEAIKQELERSKGVAELAQAVVNTAKVEVDYLRASGQEGSRFLKPKAEPPALPNGAAGSHNVEQRPGERSGITSITRYALKG